MDCLSQDQIVEYLVADEPAAEYPEWDTHLRACQKCRLDLARTYRMFEFAAFVTVTDDADLMLADQQPPLLQPNNRKKHVRRWTLVRFVVGGGALAASLLLFAYFFYTGGSSVAPVAELQVIGASQDLAAGSGAGVVEQVGEAHVAIIGARTMTVRLTAPFGGYGTLLLIWGDQYQLYPRKGPSLAMQTGAREYSGVAVVLGESRLAYAFTERSAWEDSQDWLDELRRTNKLSQLGEHLGSDWRDRLVARGHKSALVAVVRIDGRATTAWKKEQAGWNEDLMVVARQIISPGHDSEFGPG